MRYVPLLSLLLLLTAVNCSDPAGPDDEPEYARIETESGRSWNLVWNDEFDYEGLPEGSKWNYEVGRIRNNEAQYYTRARPENARVEGGNLVIESRMESYEGGSFTSASVTKVPARLDILTGWPFSIRWTSWHSLTSSSARPPVIALTAAAMRLT